MPSTAQRRPSRDTLQNEEFLDRFIPYVLFRLTNRLDQMLRDNLRTLGISQGRWRVMAILNALGPSTITRIVEYTVMEQPTVSRVVQQLERDKLVRRSVSRDDQRASTISLTGKGHAYFDEIFPKAALHQDVALEGFSAKEIEALRGLLARIAANIDLCAPPEA